MSLWLAHLTKAPSVTKHKIKGGKNYAIPFRSLKKLLHFHFPKWWFEKIHFSFLTTMASRLFCRTFLWKERDLNKIIFISMKGLFMSWEGVGGGEIQESAGDYAQHWVTNTGINRGVLRRPWTKGLCGHEWFRKQFIR